MTTVTYGVGVATGLILDNIQHFVYLIGWKNRR
jgi:hypothetical protein